MKKIQNKIDQESDEIKKKEYYSSSEYKMMEKKKKKIGLARMKTKTVSFISILPQTFTIWSFFITVLESFFKDIFRQQIKVGWLKLSGHQKFDFGSFSNWESKLLWKWFSSTFTTFFKNNNLNRYVFTIKANINGFSVHPSVHLRGGLTQKPLNLIKQILRAVLLHGMSQTNMFAHMVLKRTTMPVLKTITFLAGYQDQWKKKLWCGTCWQCLLSQLL